MKFFQKVNFLIKQFFLVIYLRRPYKKYHIELVNTDRQREEIYHLRFEIYCLRDKLLRPEDYPNGMECDKYDGDSIHFIVYDTKKKPVGTVRLILQTDNGFPTEDEFMLESIVKKIQPKTIAEVSRFLVVPEYRKSLLMVDLCKTVYLYSKKNGIDFWVGCVENWFLDSLNRLLGPIDVVSQPKFCFNAMNYPFLLPLATAEKNVLEKGKGLFYYFTHLGNNIKIS